MAELDPQNIHSASTSWTANATTSGFTGCVRLTFHSNMMSTDKPRPILNYMAFQVNVQFRTGGVMYGGVLPLRDFTSGSFCTNLTVEVGVYLFLHKIFVSNLLILIYQNTAFCLTKVVEMLKTSPILYLNCIRSYF